MIEVETDLVRGQWLDPADAQMAAADWAEVFLSLCRRLEPATLAT